MLFITEDISSRIVFYLMKQLMELRPKFKSRIWRLIGAPQKFLNIFVPWYRHLWGVGQKYMLKKGNDSIGWLCEFLWHPLVYSYFINYMDIFILYCTITLLYWKTQLCLDQRLFTLSLHGFIYSKRMSLEMR